MLIRIIEAGQTLEFTIAGGIRAIPAEAFFLADFSETHADGRIPDTDAEFFEVQFHIVGVDQGDDRFVNEVRHGMFGVARRHALVVHERHPVGDVRVVGHNRENNLHLGDDRQ